MWEECILPESKTPQLAEAQGTIALALSTCKKEFRSEYKWKWEEKSKVKERHTEKDKARKQATRNKRSTAHHGWHEYGLTLSFRHLSLGSS